jgi:hypothetical protein
LQLIVVLLSTDLCQHFLAGQVELGILIFGFDCDVVVNEGTTMIASEIVLNNPMTDFPASVSRAFTSFSWRLRVNKSLDISPMAVLSFLVNFPRFVGILVMIGNTCASMKKNLFIAEALGLCPNASNTSATTECFPSSEPKSWENPAIPIVSNLELRHLPSLNGKIHCSRDMIHPSIGLMRNVC